MVDWIPIEPNPLQQNLFTTSIWAPTANSNVTIWNDGFIVHWAILNHYYPILILFPVSCFWLTNILANYSRQNLALNGVLNHHRTQSIAAESLQIIHIGPNSNITMWNDILSHYCPSTGKLFKGKSCPKWRIESPWNINPLLRNIFKSSV